MRRFRSRLERMAMCMSCRTTTGSSTSMCTRLEDRTQSGRVSFVFLCRFLRLALLLDFLFRRLLELFALGLGHLLDRGIAVGNCNHCLRQKCSARLRLAQHQYESLGFKSAIGV